MDEFARRGRHKTGEEPGRWDKWMQTLVADGQVHRVAARLFDERADYGAWHLVAHELGDLLRELGDCWASGDLSVPEEHVASSLLQRGLAMVAESLPVGNAAPICLLATAEGDDHTLGLALVELCLREAGWRGEWLGRATRTEDIVNRVRSGHLAMVALSASSGSKDAAHLEQIARHVGSTCRRAGVPLAIGGEGAWPEKPAYGRRHRDVVRFYRGLNRPVSGYTKPSASGRGSAW